MNRNNKSQDSKLQGIKLQDIELQRAKKTDISTLVEFLRNLFALEKDFTFDPKLQETALLSILDNPEHATIYLIKLGDETVGMVVLHLSISTAEGGWAGRIEDLYIKPQFRRQGIGGQVMETLAEIAKNRDLKRLTLIADKDNPPALSFYKSCGFSEMNLVSFIRRIDL